MCQSERTSKGVEMSARSTYTPEDGETICVALSEGHSLLSICEAMGIAYTTAMRWEDEIPEHSVNAARARERGCRAMAEEMQRIADTPEVGEIRTIKADGTEEVRYEDMTNHRRLRIETRKWLLSKWASKVYGDRQHIEHSGTVGIADVLREAKEKRRGEA